MTYKTLTFDLEDNVAWITLNRPAVFNALNLDLARELCDVANRCSLDRSGVREGIARPSDGLTVDRV